MGIGATLTRVRDRVAQGRRDPARPAAQPRVAAPEASDPRRTAPRTAAAVGVDIGSAWIKVVELTGGRDGVSVRARLTVPTPPGTVRGGGSHSRRWSGGCCARRSVTRASGRAGPWPP